MVQLGTTFPRIPLPLWFWVWVGQREICIKLGRQSFHSQIQYEFNQKGSANVLARSPRSPSFSVRLCSKGSQLQLFFRSLFPDYLLLFSCSVVSNSATPWTAACHAALLSTLSRSLLKLVSIESVIHPTISSSVPTAAFLLPSIFPSIRVFSSELTLCIKWPKYWSFSTSPSMNIQGWFPLEWTALISLQSKALSRVSQSHLAVYDPWGWSMEVTDGAILPKALLRASLQWLSEAWAPSAHFTHEKSLTQDPHLR